PAAPAAPPAAPGRPGGPIRIGSLGRLHPVKGYDVLIQALARLQCGGFAPARAYEVVIAGDGKERARLEALASGLGVRGITFAGFQDRPRDFLAGLHLYLQPSRSEGLCVAAHEAMQAGLPTLVSTVGELPKTVVDGETGLVVRPGDVEALAHALTWFLGHPDRLAAFGAAARHRVLDRFSAAAFRQAGTDILKRMCAQPYGEVVAPGPEAVPRASGRSA
ncbi:MAG: glycosyltransferase family 4 protein, partial [Phenylobacterium sp.]|uniref:glycosyltransferase family 4 protein n=1 Tax=Phenylobacterium sp. TaxID=1871053 RepID=UPI001A4EBDE1